VIVVTNRYRRVVPARMLRSCFPENGERTKALTDIGPPLRSAHSRREGKSMWHDVLVWFDHHGAGVGAIAAVVTGIVAIWSLASATRDSRRRTQPNVIAEIRRAPDSDTSFDFVLRNAGPTVARDIIVTFDPDIVIPEDRQHESLATEWLIKRYRRPIPMLAPGQELSNTYWLGVAKGDKRVNGEPTPDNVSVSVRYRGVGRGWLRGTFVIDIDIITLGTSTTSSDSFKGRLRSIDESLRVIAQQAKEL
jgi:hypothetical protein